MEAMKRERGWNKGPRRARMKERFVRMPWIFFSPKTISPKAISPKTISPKTILPRTALPRATFRRKVCRAGILPRGGLRQGPPRQAGPLQGPLPRGRVRVGRPIAQFPVLGIRRRYRPRARVLHLQEQRPRELSKWMANPREDPGERRVSRGAKGHWAAPRAWGMWGSTRRIGTAQGTARSTRPRRASLFSRVGLQAYMTSWETRLRGVN